MSINYRAIFIIIAISAAVFGGIIFFGLRSKTALIQQTGESSPITSGVTLEIPDASDPSGLENDLDQRQSAQNADSDSVKKADGTIVIKKTLLPAPVIPVEQSPPLKQKPLDDRAPRPQSNAFPAPILPLRSSGSSRATTSSALPFVPQEPSPKQAAAIASFSVFDVSPQLRDFRAQMVREGVIKETEFVKINNNRDMEQFLLRLVAWHGKKASSTPGQMQDAQDRIIKAYDQLNR